MPSLRILTIRVAEWYLILLSLSENVDSLSNRGQAPRLLDHQLHVQQEGRAEQLGGGVQQLQAAHGPRLPRPPGEAEGGGAATQPHRR